MLLKAALALAVLATPAAAQVAINWGLTSQPNIAGAYVQGLQAHQQIEAQREAVGEQQATNAREARRYQIAGQIADLVAAHRCSEAAELGLREAEPGMAQTALNICTPAPRAGPPQ